MYRIGMKKCLQTCNFSNRQSLAASDFEKRYSVDFVGNLVQRWFAVPDRNFQK
jgi:hypothetical protein